MAKWGLPQECGVGLTFENLSVYFTKLTKKEKPYDRLNSTLVADKLSANKELPQPDKGHLQQT